MFKSEIPASPAGGRNPQQRSLGYFLFGFWLLFGIWLLFIGIFPLFAQHEGHQMPAQTKEEVKPAVKKSTSKKAVYYCPMHPSYTSDKPGDCPICNMTLVLKEEDVASSEEIPEGAVKIDSYKQQLIGVKIDKVAYQPFERKVRTVGRVAFDPELYKAQQEYIEAVKTLEKINSSGDNQLIHSIQSMVDASALKLELNGLSKQQIADLANKKESDKALLISSVEDNTAWVYATIYEYELDWIKVGEEATIKAISYPEKEFKGEILAIDPVFDTATRSVRARIKVDNPEALLKPNMYVDVEIRSELGAKLAVPKETILDSGIRKIVFVSLPDGYFKPVEVKTGAFSEEYVEIKAGLKEGDSVVVSGNFLIDSESKLKAALEGTGHQHGQ